MYFICLDKKGRLVLPLEIRDALGIKTNGKILFSVSAAQGGKDGSGGRIIIELAKAPENIDGIPCSKNCKTIRGENYEI